MPTSNTERLKAAIKRANDSGLSLNEIAKLAGIATPQLWHFMKDNRDIRLATADSLAAILGMELCEPRIPIAGTKAKVSKKTASQNRPRRTE
jgi:hypothetical protein